MTPNAAQILPPPPPSPQNGIDRPAAIIACAGMPLDLRKLTNLLGHLEAQYGHNPYHNRMHAADVLLGVHCFVQQGWRSDGAQAGAPSASAVPTAPTAPSPPSPSSAVTALSASASAPGAQQGACDGDGWGLTPLQMLAGLFAAAVHDFAHPGTSNAHEIMKDSELAIRYHDRSVLESHHLASAFAALLMPQHNFLCEWDRKTYMEFRKLTGELVMMTDLSKHFEFIGALNARDAGDMVPAQGAPGASAGAGAADATTALTIAIKAADLGHSVKPWALHRKWSLSVTDEFFRLGDAERAAGLPISTFCDREKDNDLPKSQIGFLQFVCRPYFAAVAHVLPGSHAHATLEHLDANLKQWSAEAEVAAGGTVELRA